LNEIPYLQQRRSTHHPNPEALQRRLAGTNIWVTAKVGPNDANVEIRQGNPAYERFFRPGQEQNG
jgi:hypothetical protein